MVEVDSATPKEDKAIREIQEHDSPEGAPPPMPTRKRTWVLFLAGFVALSIATLIALFAIDGATAVAVGVAMLFGYAVLGGAVAIIASIHRAEERAEIDERFEGRQ